MATQLSEHHGNSNPAQPPADVHSPTEKKYDVHVSVGSASSRSRSAPVTSLLKDSNQESNAMATQQSEEQGNSYHEEQPADIENVYGSVGSASSQFEGAPDISEEEAERHNYRPLLRAAFRGDWEFAKGFFERNPDSKTAKLTSRSETALHIAALSAQDQFVENLVELLSPEPEMLKLVDCDGSTALHNAVLCGRIRMVKALVKSNPKLTQLPDNKGRVPLGIAAVEASMHKEIAWFLAKSTTDDGPNHRPFSSPSAFGTMIGLTFAGHHDITLYLVEQYPHLITMKGRYYDRPYSLLHGLSSMRSHFPSGTRLSILEALIYKCIPVDLNYKPTDKNVDPALQCLTRSLWIAIKIVVPMIERIHEVKLRHVAAVELAKQCCIAVSTMNTIEITYFFQEGGVLYQATTNGISEIVKLCIQFFPELIRIPHYGARLTTHAVDYRRERTLVLLSKVREANELSLVPGPTPKDSKDLMLRAGQYHPSPDVTTDVTGAAFQMQRELQWYKAVESCVIPEFRNAMFGGDRPEDRSWNLFVKNHKELLEKGEKWVKDTANSCMLVSTLIATVLFAAAFTVPGGNDDETGVPLLLGQDAVLVFAISDALGLFSSVTAILLFLAILTSRYEAQDFLDSLPRKIIMGLCFLFLSLAFMLVAFGATLSIVLHKRLQWVLVPITLLASFPVTLFVLLQLPLLYQMVKSTYGPSIFRVEDI